MRIPALAVIAELLVGVTLAYGYMARFEKRVCGLVPSGLFYTMGIIQAVLSPKRHAILALSSPTVSMLPADMVAEAAIFCVRYYRHVS